ncbi:MAG TPA: hypothetical protein VI056_03765, partial [Candidatus Limnocylindria bacterium]
MAVLRPITKLASLSERPALRAIQPTTLDEGWTPEVLKLSRTNDEAEVQLVNRVHARIAASLGRTAEAASGDAIRALLAEQFPIALDEERLTLNRTDRL